MKIGLAALRVLIGGLFVGHGTQKLFGWFGGHGIEGTAGFFESIGLKPGKRAAQAAGVSEAAGGALLVAGALTPVAAAALIGTMVQAIKTVHAPKGPWVTDGGWEYNGVLIAALVALAEAGPGAFSIDGDRLSGPGYAFAALAAGVAGPSIVLRQQASAPEQTGFETAAGAPAS